MKILCEFSEMVPISELKSNPRNRNQHSAEQIDRLAFLFQNHGIRHPIIISKRSGFIVAGHGRLAAAQKLGLTELPVDYQDFETEEAEYQFLIADNAIAAWAELDLSAINLDLADIGPFDIDLLGLKDFVVDVSELDKPKEPDPPRKQTGKSILINADCLEHLKTMAENSIDSLVTDPPAGISFMGKEWDDDKGGSKEWIAWMTEVMSQCLRVLKPGGHGLVWAIPRTSHWTATALENAGFEIRDVITHLFGSGFPKSLDISKAIDKAAGAERVLGPSVGEMNGRNTANHKKEHEILAEVNGWDKRTSDPATDAAKQWQGWGTALKPASEHWILVRKPCSEKTVAANVLKWGVGGINIDECRVWTETITQHQRDFSNIHGNKFGPGVIQPVLEKTTQTVGRFPANLVLSHNPDCELSPHVFPDGSEKSGCTEGCAIAALDEQSGVLNTHAGKYSEDKPPAGNIILQKENKSGYVCSTGDTGGASRFFYCAKTSSSERNEGLGALSDKKVHRYGAGIGEGLDPDAPALDKNHHPTVKPIDLMEYFIKLITPIKGVVLDPFMGSGSTGVAAGVFGCDFYGIEREKEYYDIACARITTHKNSPINTEPSTKGLKFSKKMPIKGSQP